MDNRPRSKIKQSEARKKHFAHNQYWCLSYTECYKRGAERDFKTIIKARSAKLAKEILVARLEEDKNFSKIRSLTTSMIHECWHIADLRRKLSVTQWESIRNVAFPNDWNKVFKFEKKRLKGQFNRYNVPHLKLSAAHKAKLAKACNELVQKHLKDSFKPLCPDLQELCNKKAYYKDSSRRKGFATLRDPNHREMELAYLKSLLKKYYGNIQWAADETNTHTSVFRRALKRFPEVDWKKEFPLTKVREPKVNSMDKPGAREKLSQTLKASGHKPPANSKGTLNYKKWKESISQTWNAKKEKLYSDWKKKLVAALRENGHKRTETAASLGITTSHLVRLMKRFVEEDPEFQKEFWSPEISMRLKTAACRKTRKENRENFIKENKHLIMQAYHQNGKEDYKAAKLFKVDPRTFKAWREDIEKS